MFTRLNKWNRYRLETHNRSKHILNFKSTVEQEYAPGEGKVLREEPTQKKANTTKKLLMFFLFFCVRALITSLSSERL